MGFVMRGNVMQLIQILLPVRDNDGLPYSEHVLQAVSKQLVDKFGGCTAFSRVPARGVWVDADRVAHDDVIVIEVMAPAIDAAWWADFREKLERQLRQKEIVIRGHAIARL
jgi:hypothetical protein